VGSAAAAGIAVAADGDRFGVLQKGMLLPEMLAIPGGRFRMGNNGPAVNPATSEDFAHVHEVTLSAFRMSRFLVTNAQYLAFTSATRGEPPCHHGAGTPTSTATRTIRW